MVTYLSGEEEESCPLYAPFVSLRRIGHIRLLLFPKRRMFPMRLRETKGAWETCLP